MGCRIEKKQNSDRLAIASLSVLSDQKIFWVERPFLETKKPGLKNVTIVEFLVPEISLNGFDC